MKQGGNKEFFLESKITPLRRLLEMHQVFSPCSPSGGSQEMRGTTWKRSGQLPGSYGILRRPEMKYQKDFVQQSWMGNLQNPWHSQLWFKHQSQRFRGDFTSPRETWRSMDSQLDALHVMESRLEGEVQEFTTLNCVETGLKNV